jgi:hypothetical protein
VNAGCDLPQQISLANLLPMAAFSAAAIATTYATRQAAPRYRLILKGQKIPESHQEHT